ncbi:MAG: hypothetical protein R6V76_00865, partial [Desulfobacterales bacterium]
MKVKIHEIATKEFDEAVEWYENQSKGLGQRFKKAVLEQVRKIKKNPEWFLIEVDNIYKVYIPKFPYKATAICSMTCLAMPKTVAYTRYCSQRATCPGGA